MDHEKLVRVYLKMKERRAQLERERAEIWGKMEQIQGLLLKSLLDNKAKSMATAVGTFYIKQDVKVNCTDWETYRRWMIANDALDGVEKRVTKSFIVDFMRDNNDELPPGITALKEQVVGIRTTP